MVSDASIKAICVTLLISLFVPVFVYIFYGIRNKKKGVWTAWLLGAAGFFVPQMLVRSPILSLLAMNEGFVAFAQNYYVIYCLVLALTAALFEVLGRYAVARIMKKKLTFERGVAAGLGHGGIEAITIVGLSYISNLVFSQMINAGLYDNLVAETATSGVDTSALLTMKDALIQTTTVEYYLAGYERILTMILHVALSLMVCHFVWLKRDRVGVIASMLIHTVVDFLTVILNGLSTDYLGNLISQKTAYVLVYTFLTLVAVAAVLYIVIVRKGWKSAQAEMEKQTA